MTFTAPDIGRTLKLWHGTPAELLALMTLMETVEGQTANEAAASCEVSLNRWSVWTADWQKRGLATRTLDPRTNQGRPRRRYHATPKATEALALEINVTF